MDDEYQMKRTFENKVLKGMILIGEGCLTKLEIWEGDNEILDYFQKLMRLRDLVERSLAAYEKSEDRMV